MKLKNCKIKVCLKYVKSVYYTHMNHINKCCWRVHYSYDSQCFNIHALYQTSGDAPRGL